MKEQFFETVEKFRMIKAGDHVMVCVSGGADSMALLSLFLETREQLGIGGLTACHFNHGLRGQESDADERQVRDFCKEAGVELRCGAGRMSEQPLPKGESTESYARKLRYDFFAVCAHEYCADKVAIAHNKNDAAETAILNMTRGAGVKGVRGIVPVRERYIRPLIEIGRQEIEAYCTARKIHYVTDSTNLSAQHARNRVRLAIVPELEQINSAAVDNIARHCSHMAEVWDYLAEAVARNLSSARCPTGYDINCLLKKGRLVAKYSLQSILEGCGVEVSQATLENALLLLEGGVRTQQLTSSIFLHNNAGILAVEDLSLHAVSKPFSAVAEMGGNRFVAGKLVRLKLVENLAEIDRPEKFSKNLINDMIDYDRIIGVIVLRNRKQGDRFTSRRRNNTKSLKKLFNEKKISVRDRDSIAILSDDEGILWLEGEGACARVAVDETTKRAITIEVVKGNDDA